MKLKDIIREWARQGAGACEENTHYSSRKNKKRHNWNEREEETRGADLVMPPKSEVTWRLLHQ